MHAAPRSLLILVVVVSPVAVVHARIEVLHVRIEILDICIEVELPARLVLLHRLMHERRRRSDSSVLLPSILVRLGRLWRLASKSSTRLLSLTGAWSISIWVCLRPMGNKKR